MVVPARKRGVGDAKNAECLTVVPANFAETRRNLEVLANWRKAVWNVTVQCWMKLCLMGVLCLCWAKQKFSGTCSYLLCKAGRLPWQANSTWCTGVAPISHASKKALWHHPPPSSTELQNPTNLRRWQLLFSLNFLLPLQHSERTSTGAKGNSRIHQWQCTSISFPGD